MQGRPMRPPRLHNLQLPTFDRPHPDLIPDCRSRYTNLCAFASDLIRENIDLPAWEDIMTTAFNRARNNLSPRMSIQGSSGRMDTRNAYLRGAEAWASYNIVQKSLRNQRISSETWRMWQDMFTEASSGSTNRISRNPGNSLFRASREIEWALRDMDDHNEARNARGSYRPRPRPLRIPAGVGPSSTRAH